MTLCDHIKAFEMAGTVKSHLKSQKDYVSRRITKLKRKLYTDPEAARVFRTNPSHSLDGVVVFSLLNLLDTFYGGITINMLCA